MLLSIQVPDPHREALMSRRHSRPQMLQGDRQVPVFLHRFYVKHKTVTLRCVRLPFLPRYCFFCNLRVRFRHTPSEMYRKKKHAPCYFPKVQTALPLYGAGTRCLHLLISYHNKHDRQSFLYPRYRSHNWSLVYPA